MTFVVTETCINCKLSDCVVVCPAECFVQGPNMLFIDPDLCVDCNLCPQECPIDAIYDEDDLPEDQKEFIEINAIQSKLWPVITDIQDPMPDSEKWENVKEKRHLLDLGDQDE